MENLTITTICLNESNAFNEIAKLAAKHDCSVKYSHLYSLGSEDTIIFQVAGNWSGIAKMETSLPELAKKLHIEILFKRSPQEKITRHFLPYRVEIIGAEQPGLVYDIHEFFEAQEVHIQRWETYTDLYQLTVIFRLQMLIYIPVENNIADMREQFLLFCDELNLDGILEPEK